MLQVSRTAPAPKRVPPNCSGKSQFAWHSLPPLACAAPAFAADDNADTTTEHGSFSILFENDTFFNTDRDYTSGQALAYTTAPTTHSPGLLSWGALPDLFGSGEARAGDELGQVIFMPETVDVPNPPLNERPYAGFLWLGLSVITNTDERLNQVEMQLGVIGPASLAGNAQIFVHAVALDRFRLSFNMCSAAGIPHAAGIPAVRRNQPHHPDRIELLPL